MKSFEQRLLASVEDSLIKLVQDGGFITATYENRLKVDPTIMREIYERIDLKRVVVLAAERAEERMADTVFNALAQELASDVKQILSNKELREECRALIRDKMRERAAIK